MRFEPIILDILRRKITLLKMFKRQQHINI